MIIIKNNILAQLSESVSHFNETQLPQNSQVLINSIHNLHTKIIEYSLSPEQDLEVKNMYDKRLAQVQISLRQGMFSYYFVSATSMTGSSATYFPIFSLNALK